MRGEGVARGEPDQVRPQRHAADRLRVARDPAPAAAVAGADPGNGPGPPRLAPCAAQTAAVLPARAGGQPGRRAQRPAGSFTVADMAGDIVAVLDAAGIGRAHVLGASLGGMVAQELAIAHPARVDGLVLVCTAPGWPFAYPMPAASVRAMASAVRMTAEAARRRHTENALSAATVRRHPELVNRLLERQAARPVDADVLPAQAAAGARYAGWNRQRHIGARTLVLHGGGDRVVDPRNGRLLADRIPGARLVTFPELGHLLFWEDPDGFADVVTSFLLAREQTLHANPAVTRACRRSNWTARSASPSPGEADRASRAGPRRPGPVRSAARGGGWPTP